MRFPKSSIDVRVAAAAVLLAGGASACRLDMQDAPRFDPMEKTPLFENGSSARVPVEGTVAQLKSQPWSESEPEAYTQSIEFTTGMTEDYDTVKALPPGMELTAELMERGKERYDIYCSPCHGYTGEGNGMIVQRGFRAPPTFHSERLREVELGHFYSVITNGYGAMFSYNHAVHPKDRWAIATYIRALQLSQYAPVEYLPSEERAKLEETE